MGVKVSDDSFMRDISGRCVVVLNYELARVFTGDFWLAYLEMGFLNIIVSHLLALISSFNFGSTVKKDWRVGYPLWLAASRVYRVPDAPSSLLVYRSRLRDCSACAAFQLFKASSETDSSSLRAYTLPPFHRTETNGDKYLSGHCGLGTCNNAAVFARQLSSDTSHFSR